MHSSGGRDLGVSNAARKEKSRGSDFDDQNSPLLECQTPASANLSRPDETEGYSFLDSGFSRYGKCSAWWLIGSAALCLAVGLLVLVLAGYRGPGELFHSEDDLVNLPDDDDLAPLDEPMGMECPTHGVLHFVPRLAGPWGLPITMDGPAHLVPRNLFLKHAVAEREKVHRAVIFFDLNHPRNTYCKLRHFLNEHGGRHVTALTVGFPSLEMTRGLGPSMDKRVHCAAVWNRDFMWLANQNATARPRCHHSNVTPTPCELIMGLVRRLRAPEFPNIKDIRVLGFSAGGQMLDKCLYSHSRFFEWNDKPEQQEPQVKFIIVSPSTIFYPMPERAILPLLPQLDCEYFAPSATLQRDYDFRELDFDDSDNLADMSKSQSWYCHRKSRHDNELNRQECEALNGESKLYVYRYRFPGESGKFPGCLHQGLPCNCCRKAKDSYERQRQACHHYDRYRYGLAGKVPKDFPQYGPCSRDSCPTELQDWIGQALLQRHAIYIAGSADVCNWHLQSDEHFQPSCGWCSTNRSSVLDSEEDFARDKLSPVVDSCRAIWEGFTRLERMKVYKEALRKVLAPRLGISEEDLNRTRQFYTLVGVGHSDNSMLDQLAPFLATDNATKSQLVAMDLFV